MTSEEKIEIIKEAQKKYYPGREVWRLADGKKHTVLSPYLNEYDELRVYTTQKRGSFLASSLGTTPPLPDGYYVFQDTAWSKGVLIRRQGGNMCRIYPDGGVMETFPGEISRAEALHRIVPDGETVKFEKVELPEEGE